MTTTTTQLTPTARRILAQIQDEGIVKRADLGAMRSGSWETATARALRTLLADGLIQQEPTPEHAGRVQYRVA